MQACREDCGAGAPLDAHFCPQCRKILPLPRQADYFTFLGLPRKLTIAADDLEQRFRALSRQFHPDFFYNGTTFEKRASLERSSYLNDAYRDAAPAGCAGSSICCKLEGLAASKNEREASRRVSPALLEEVFALNEELDEIRELRETARRRSEWQARGSIARACRSRQNAPSTRRSCRSWRRAGSRTGRGGGPPTGARGAAGSVPRAQLHQ